MNSAASAADQERRARRSLRLTLRDREHGDGADGEPRVADRVDEPAGSHLAGDDVGYTGDRRRDHDRDRNQRDRHREEQRNERQLDRARRSKRLIDAYPHRQLEHHQADERREKRKAPGRCEQPHQHDGRDESPAQEPLGETLARGQRRASPLQRVGDDGLLFEARLRQHTRLNIGGFCDNLYVRADRDALPGPQPDRSSGAVSDPMPEQIRGPVEGGLASISPYRRRRPGPNAFNASAAGSPPWPRRICSISQRIPTTRAARSSTKPALARNSRVKSAGLHERAFLVGGSVTIESGDRGPVVRAESPALDRASACPRCRRRPPRSA